MKQEVQIFVCDDERIFLKTMEAQLHAIGEELHCQLQITLFQNPQIMLAELLNGTISADILLLDIDMPELSGLEAANRIRVQFPEITIVFLSNYDEYVFQSFDKEPACFIRKIDSRNSLEQVIRQVLAHKTYLRESRVLLSTDEEDVVVDLSQVCYAVGDAEQVRLCFLNGTELRIQTSFHLLAEAMEESGIFIRMHGGGLLNTMCITEFKWNTICLRNGQQIPASQVQQERIRRHIMSRWR